MNYQVTEQVVHDRINLLRLVRRLEKSVDSDEWLEDTRVPSRAAWIRMQGVLQRLKYARRLLRNVELNYDLEETSSTDRYEELKGILDRLEYVIQDANERVTPQTVRQPSRLRSLPLPAPSARKIPASVSEGSALNPALSVDPVTDLAAHDLLLSPSDTLPPLSSSLTPQASPLLPIEQSARPAERPANVATVGNQSFLQNSRALQEEMSEQLANMAAQLKRNAIHFAGSLDKDKAIVQEAQEKLEKNFDVMSKERVRLRDHRSKSWGTTWIVILSIVVVTIGFILSFFVIRLT